MLSCQYMDSHYIAKTVSWSSHLYNGDLIPRKDGTCNETGHVNRRKSNLTDDEQGYKLFCSGVEWDVVPICRNQSKLIYLNLTEKKQFGSENDTRNVWYSFTKSLIEITFAYGFDNWHKIDTKISCSLVKETKDTFNGSLIDKVK